MYVIVLSLYLTRLFIENDRFVTIIWCKCERNAQLARLYLLFYKTLFKQFVVKFWGVSNATDFIFIYLNFILFILFLSSIK